MVAGEASGDLLGSRLIEALRERLPHAEFFGIGGPKMIAAGFDSWFPQEQLAVRGFVEVVRHLREIHGIRRRLAARLMQARPQLFVGIDAPDFNLALARRLKGAGVRTAHFVSPTVWAWRRGRLKTIKAAISHMLVLFPFEEAIYRRAGIPVTYTGHPLADEIPPDIDQAAIREQLRVGGMGRIVALLPGSRQSEVELMAPLFIEAAKLIARALPDTRFLVPFATRETRALFEQALYDTNGLELPLTLLFGHALEAMAAADVALVKSGTVTLEAALLRRPMVIAYRVTPLTFAIAKRIIRVKHIGLPNVLADEWLVPEFVQDEATPQNLAQAVVNLALDRVVRDALETRFATLHDRLRCNAAARAADALMPLLETGVARG